MKILRDKNALITGGSRGIGPFIARALACESVNVALVARSSEQLHQVAREVERLGVRAIAIRADIRSEVEREAAVDRARTALGSIDILVNNAAINQAVAFEQQDAQSIEQITATNVLATLLLTRLTLPAMLERQCGHIVTISSLHGKKGQAYCATYSATKAALIEWTSALRGELKGSGVSASVICPGLVAEVGMWAACHAPTPRWLGLSTPEQLAQAVIRAIRDDQPESIVNPTPVWLALVLNAFSPALANCLSKRLGYVQAVRRIAEQARSISNV
jgi:short-subunit dehydrogenase